MDVESVVAPQNDRFERDRIAMVEHQLVRRGITDARVINAFREVPREQFAPDHMPDLAYDDRPLPIDCEQTISQPYIVALTLEALALRGYERVLEIGTGSGYAAALLARLAREVFTVERHEALADVARTRLRALGLDNVHVRCADGTLGWVEHAPYDAIAVAAAGPEVPRALLSQLALGGRLVIPVGADESSQVLTCVTRRGPREFTYREITPVRFVPLIGEQGWPDAG